MKQENKKLAVLQGEIVPRKKESKGQQVIIGTLNIFAPPVAAKYHRRYDKLRRGHLIIDTVLTLIIFVLLALNIFYLTSDDLLPNPDIDISISAPESVSNGERVELSISINNPTNSALKDLRISIEYPEGFIFESSSIETSTAEQNYWDIGELDGGQKKDLLIIGNQYLIDEQNILHGIAQYTSGDETFSKNFNIKYIIYDIDVEVEIEVPKEIVSDEEFKLAVRILNETENALPEGQLIMNFPNGYRMKNVSRIFEISSGWKVSEIESGGNWEIIYTGLIDTELKKIASFDLNYVISSGKYNLVEINKSHEITVLPITNVKENLDTKPDEIIFVAEAHYYSSSGVQFGYGSLPPQVGKLTGYRIFWTIKNNQDITGAVVKAKLPVDVIWAGNVSVSAGQNISYDSDSREITWPIGTVNSGQITLTASFEVQIIPTGKYIGKTINLLEESFMTAKLDNTKIEKIYGYITTDLNEALSEGKGVVVE